jgi:FkbM family methyltransferase
LFFPNGSRPLVLMNEVWWKDEYEIGNVNVKPGDTVVDIGANVGVFTWNVLQRFPNIFVYAVEPHPTNFEFLKRNLSSYSRAARVRRLAISRINGEIEMYSPEWLDGVRTRSDHSPPGNERWRNHGCVASCPLSLFLERNELYRVALLKIDIEGAESDLLLEFQADVFATIDRIVMETHEFNHPGLTNEFENLFISKGYDVQRKKIADDRFILLMAQ